MPEPLEPEEELLDDDELEDELELLEDELEELDDDELDELLEDEELLLEDELLDEGSTPDEPLPPPQAARTNVSAPALISFARRCW